MGASSTELGEFRRSVCEHFEIELGERIVVGASGGLDSTVLLRLLQEAGFTVIAAHVNYGLRGEESDRDEGFVKEIADELGIAFHAVRVRLPNDENLQSAARRARYTFFEEVAKLESAHAMAVAHHQGDQAETVLLNLFRGAGPRGAAGMPASRPIFRDSTVRIIRPLLGWSRKEILDLANSRGWDWREDASNDSDAYRRNWLRNQLMPRIEEEFGEDVVGRIADAAERIRATVDLADEHVSARLDISELRASSKAGRYTRYLSALKQFAPFAPRREEAVAEIDALLDAQPGRRVVWPGVTVWREREALVFELEGREITPHIWPVQIGGSTKTPFGTLTIEPLEVAPADSLGTDNNMEIVDAAALVEPLQLRFWHAGDRFNPLGLRGSKLVSDLLTETKTPASQRPHQLVLCSGASILWVVGRRMAEEGRIRSSRTRAARLVWKPAETLPQQSSEGRDSKLR